MILIVGALTFFPALSLGPIVEHLLMRRGSCSEMAIMHTKSRVHLGSADRPHGACVDAFRKLNPRTMMKNPVMFVVEVGSVLTTVACSSMPRRAGRDLGFELQITFWLWLTVLFANFAEAMAEGRGKAQADTLRKTRTETVAQRVITAARPDRDRAGARACARTTS